ncbi:hypothetical protein Tco_0046249 [Tanacetum coccineum]
MDLDHNNWECFETNLILFLEGVCLADLGCLVGEKGVFKESTPPVADLAVSSGGGDGAWIVTWGKKMMELGKDDEDGGLLSCVFYVSKNLVEDKCIVTASGPGFGDWQWRLVTLPFAFGGLGTKLLRHTGIVSPGPVFDDALSVFNTSMETDFLSNQVEMLPTNSLNTFVDICYRSGISAGKEVDIGLDGGRDKPLRPSNILLYSWDGGLDVCVDLTGSSPLTQTGMVDFVPSQAVIDATQRKCGKYMDMCAAIGYGFLPFSFSSLGELGVDAVTLA